LAVIDVTIRQRRAILLHKALERSSLGQSQALVRPRRRRGKRAPRDWQNRRHHGIFWTL